MVTNDPSRDTRLVIARYLADVAQQLRGDEQQTDHVLALDWMCEAVLRLPAEDDAVKDVARLFVHDGILKPDETFKKQVDLLKSTTFARRFLREIVGLSQINEPPCNAPSR